MSFQFVNNWPYSSTTFPTMIDHVDPVNNTYFTGLMTELGRIEYYLGIHPQGSYKDVAERLAGLVSIIQANDDNIWNTLNPDVAEDFADVKDKLENHGHSGGTDGKQLVIPIPGVWEEISFVGTIGDLEIVPGSVGGSYTGFAYYNLIYLGPCERAAGNRRIQCFNTTTDEHTWQDSIIVNQPKGAVWIAPYGIFSIIGTPGSILRFNPETWEEVETNLAAGLDSPGHLCKPDGNAWGGTYTSPAKIFRYNPANHVHASWTMDAGENEILACCTDGSYIWACCNTDPVKLIKFHIASKTHTTYTLTGLKPEIVFMFFHSNMVYMFSNNATVQWARFNPFILGMQRWEPDFPYPFRHGTEANGRWLLTIASGGNGHILQFDPDNFAFYLSDALATPGSMLWITYANNHVVWISAAYKDKEAPITIVNP